MGEKAALDAAKAQMASPHLDGLAMRLKTSPRFQKFCLILWQGVATWHR